MTRWSMGIRSCLGIKFSCTQLLQGRTKEDDREPKSIYSIHRVTKFVYVCFDGWWLNNHL